MNNALENASTTSNRRSLLKNIGKMILRIVGAGLVVIVGLF